MAKAKAINKINDDNKCKRMHTLNHTHTEVHVSFEFNTMRCSGYVSIHKSIHLNIQSTDHAVSVTKILESVL